MFDVLAHPDLPHQLVLVAVHPRQLPHVSKRVLDPVCQLGERHNDTQPNMQTEETRRRLVMEPRQPSFKEKLLFFELANFLNSDPHLKSIHVPKTVLDMGVDDQFGES